MSLTFFSLDGRSLSSDYMKGIRSSWWHKECGSQNWSGMIWWSAGFGGSYYYEQLSTWY